MYRYLKLITSLVLLGGAAALLLGNTVWAGNIVSGQGTSQTLELGQIKVTGQAMVLKVLQMIKLGLEEPFSSDPKLANVVVCRMHNETGSHVKQTLICATNKAWLDGRSAMQTGLESVQTQSAPGSDSFMGVSTCASNICDSEVFAPLNNALSGLSGGYLQTTVDGSKLHALLNKIPTPAQARSKVKLKNMNFPIRP